MKKENLPSRHQPKAAISRRDFILSLFFLLFLAGLGFKKKGGRRSRAVIRPPGALAEDEFLNRCIRCGNCMKVCITNGLQSVIFQSGWAGIWTPYLVPEIGYCEYHCTLCGNVCPTNAIPRLSLEQKHLVRLGTAVVDRGLCIAWAKNQKCVVCEEHCPIPEKAIRLKEDTVVGTGVLKPCVDERLCIGCGICQNKCPVRPVRAIRVFPDR